MENKQKHLWTR